MDRRNWLKVWALTPLAGLIGSWIARPAFAKGEKAVEELQKNWKLLLADGADVASSAEPLKLSDAEWKKRLSPAAYDVLRHEGTEPPAAARWTRRSDPACSCARVADCRCSPRR